MADSFVVAQTIKLSIESANIVTNFEFRNQIAVVRGKNVNVTALVAKHNAAIDDRRRSPDRRTHQMFPNQFAFVGRQTVHIAVVRSHVETIVDDYRAGPKTVLLFRLLIQSAFSLVSPDEFAAFLFVASNDAVFGGGVNKAARDRRRRVRIDTNARLPCDRAVIGLQTEKVAGFRIDVNTIVNHGRATFYRAAELLLENYPTVLQIKTIVEMIFAADVNAIADDR